MSGEARERMISSSKPIPQSPHQRCRIESSTPSRWKKGIEEVYRVTVATWRWLGDFKGGKGDIRYVIHANFTFAWDSDSA